MRSNPSVNALYERARETGRALVGGHRGNPAEWPENTLASFRSALELGVDMIECDVHMSADGELVVIHDHTLERTTDGAGLVGQHTLAELRRLDAGGGERLPVLDEVCELVRDAGASLCIEVKSSGVQERLVSQLREMDFLDQTVVISFHHDVVRALKELEARLAVGVIQAASTPDPAGVMNAVGAVIYAGHYAAVDARLCEQVTEAGGVVGVWTVDDLAAVAWCRKCRPLSIFTNRPREICAAFASAPI